MGTLYPRSVQLKAPGTGSDPRRFRLPLALARLQLGDGQPGAEIVELEPA